MSAASLLRILAFIAIFLAAGVLWWHNDTVENSGRIVGTAELWSAQAKNADDVLQAFQQNSPLFGKALNTQWIQSKPLRLAPTDGAITFTIHETETGIVKKDKRDFNAEYILLRQDNRQEIFHKKERHERAGNSSERGGTVLPHLTDNLHLGTRTAQYRLGTLTVPEATDYVLLAGFDKWFLASSNQTLVLEARAGMLPINPYIIGGGFGFIVLCFFVIFMTRDKKAEARHWKIKQ